MIIEDIKQRAKEDSLSGCLTLALTLDLIDLAYAAGKMDVLDEAQKLITETIGKRVAK